MKDTLSDKESCLNLHHGANEIKWLIERKYPKLHQLLILALELFSKSLNGAVVQFLLHVFIPGQGFLYENYSL